MDRSHPERGGKQWSKRGRSFAFLRSILQYPNFASAAEIQIGQRHSASARVLLQALNTPISGGSGSMRYLALAADYDGTLAQDGQVGQETVGALERLLA